MCENNTFLVKTLKPEKLLLGMILILEASPAHRSKADIEFMMKITQNLKFFK